MGIAQKAAYLYCTLSPVSTPATPKLKRPSAAHHHTPPLLCHCTMPSAYDAPALSFIPKKQPCQFERLRPPSSTHLPPLSALMNHRRLLCSCSPNDLPWCSLHSTDVHFYIRCRSPGTAFCSCWVAGYRTTLTPMDMIMITICRLLIPAGICTRPRQELTHSMHFTPTHSRLARFHNVTSKPPIMSHALSFPFRMPALPFPAHPFPVYPRLLTLSPTLAPSPSSVYGHISVIGFAPVARRLNYSSATANLATHSATARFTTHMTSLDEPPAHAPVFQEHFKVCGTDGTRRLPGQTDEALGRF
jgi:hypothetical protein